MSKFKLGGVPSHAYELFYKLRGKVQEPQGEAWSKAVEMLLTIDNPRDALRIVQEHCSVK